MTHKSHKHHEGCCRNGKHKHQHHNACRKSHHDGCRQEHQDGCCKYEQACGCEQGHHIKRHFLTKEEKIARLETYLHDLQTEAQAVQEHIAALKRED